MSLELLSLKEHGWGLCSIQPKAILQNRVYYGVRWNSALLMAYT